MSKVVGKKAGRGGGLDSLQREERKRLAYDCNIGISSGASLSSRLTPPEKPYSEKVALKMKVIATIQT